MSEAAKSFAGVILVVEDDPGLLLVTSEMFSAIGYDVLTASGADDALALLKSEPQIDVLFSDIVIAGDMNGIDLADEAHHEYPDLKILLASGYPQSDVPVLPEKIGFIAKPYHLKGLTDSLHNLGL